MLFIRILAPAGLAPHSPYPGFGNQPEFHRLDFANHALDELAQAKLAGALSDTPGRFGGLETKPAG